MLIQPIVEGPGDVGAVPVLLRRICYELGCCYTAQIAPAMKVSRSKMVQKDELVRYMQIASAQPGCKLVLLFMDADDDCAKELAEMIRPWMAEGAWSVPSEIIVVPREFECWLIAALESLRGIRGIREDASSHAAPEGLRDAKGFITDNMQGSSAYHESADQPALTQMVDLSAVRERCGSFRRLVEKIEQYGILSCLSE